MNNNLVWLQSLNSNGEYINLNTETGRINFSHRYSVSIHSGAQLHGYSNITGNTTVAYVTCNKNKIDNWFLNSFKKWEKNFAKNNIDQYNKLINLPL